MKNKKREQKMKIVEKIKPMSPNPVEKVIMSSQTKHDRYVWNYILNQYIIH